MNTIQRVAVLTSAAVLLFVVELIRRRRLLERYAILWIFGSVALLVLSAWPRLLDRVAPALGIAYPPAVLFLAGILILVLLAIHFSVIASRVTEQNRRLAQKIALLEEEVVRALPRAPGRREAIGEETVASPGGSRGFVRKRHELRR